MRSHDSWQCLSLQEFFSLCNWQGQPLESRTWQHQDQLLNLKEKELQAGFVLTCKAYPLSDGVILTHQEEVLVEV